ncbi:ATP-binding cassette domain-containing protein [Salsipaludibacter albus]|uniref:ATP-binding cassette domain-containing protein n=1 Tax=Salsipaludibacter albus TaxID=2849650 RepID=UPI001EE47B25|nr:ATP-binding cassette domain-containing protein [Salsipaludibacter albus]MBY5162449.1 ATP-binding cassette domain-containing protein [Salsipaludibacter albus]
MRDLRAATTDPTTTPGRVAPAIEVTGLRRSYGDLLVLDGVDLTVTPGTVFALLGPNGAGKTTVVNILTTLVDAHGGTVRVAGHDVATEPDLVRRSIGVTGQFSAIDDLFTGAENLRLMADLHHLDRLEGSRRVSELLERFDLVDAADRPATTYSGGMRRRLDLAMTLVGDPQVIFLDEPTTGLDPRSRRTMWEAVTELVDDGTTVFLTTQYLEEADRLADRVAVLDRGTIVADGTVDELKRRVPGGHVRLQFPSTVQLDTAAATWRDDGRVVGRDDRSLTLQVPGDGSPDSLRALLDRIDRDRLDVEHLSVHRPDLDDVFLALTGRGTDHDAADPEGATGTGRADPDHATAPEAVR